MAVRVIPFPNNGGPRPDGNNDRVETGPVQFGNDWPGLFIRGDDCLALALELDAVLEAIGRANLAGVGNPDFFRLQCAVVNLKDLRQTIMEDVIVKPK